MVIGSSTLTLPPASAAVTARSPPPAARLWLSRRWALKNPPARLSRASRSRRSCVRQLNGWSGVVVPTRPTRPAVSRAVAVRRLLRRDARPVRAGSDGTSGDWGGYTTPAPLPARGPPRRMEVSVRRSPGAGTISGLSTRMILGPASLLLVGCSSFGPAGVITSGRLGMLGATLGTSVGSGASAAAAGASGSAGVNGSAGVSGSAGVRGGSQGRAAPGAGASAGATGSATGASAGGAIVGGVRAGAAIGGGATAGGATGGGATGVTGAGAMGTSTWGAGGASTGGAAAPRAPRARPSRRPLSW